MLTCFTSFFFLFVHRLVLMMSIVFGSCHSPRCDLRGVSLFVAPRGLSLFKVCDVRHCALPFGVVRQAHRTSVMP